MSIIFHCRDASLSFDDMINFDDITYLVRQLDETCHVCCKGGRCNKGLLPAFSALYPSAAPEASASFFSILLIAMATIW